MSKLAFVFPGQGSQSVGMLSDLAMHDPIILQIFQEARDVIAQDIWQLVQSGPTERLGETAYTQVVMLSADVAIYRLIQKRVSLKPSMMAGHSLGEYAALVCSEALPFSEAVALVHKRGQLMQAYVPLGIGGMAAVVGLENDVVEQLCQDVSCPGDEVMPANYNALGQIVIAGHMKAVERLITHAEAAGAILAKLIPVSVPCHCDLLKPAADAFSKVLSLAALTLPSCTVLNNVDALPYHSVEHMRAQLTVQLYKPVRWVQTVQSMLAAGCERIIECGPAKVLSGLIKRIDQRADVQSINSVASLEKLTI